MANQTSGQKARGLIDKKLVEAGWVVQSKDGIDLNAARGVAIRESTSDTGLMDYMPMVDGKPCGDIETKNTEGEHKLAYRRRRDRARPSRQHLQETKKTLDAEAKMTRNEFCKGTVSMAAVVAMHGIEGAEVAEPKRRAARNRTLTLDPAELPLLEKMITSGDDLAKNFTDDMIVNANVMDCLDCIPNGHFDLIIIDPPYNLDKNFHGKKFSAMPESEYEEYLRSWFYKVCDKLKPNGSLYMCGDWKCTASMQRVISERLAIVNRITWQREKGRGAKRNWKNGMEDIWFAVKDPDDYYFDVESVMMKRRVIAPYRENGKPKDWEESETGNFRKTYPSNFWDDITIPFWSMPENTDHPTQKPEKLFAKLVLASSRPGAQIFDPFLGSGTSAVVAKKLGRRFCGVEINREYCLWSAKRVMLAANDKEIQGYANGVFWERNSLSEQKRESEIVPMVEEQDLFGGRDE